LRVVIGRNEARVIATALGGRKAGCGWTALCPAHDDRHPSLSISEVDGKVLVHCHAGCDQRDVIAALQERGLWQTTGRVLGIARNQRRRHAKEPDADTLKRSAAALAIWEASHATEGTPIATYLRSRGLTISAPISIRFHGGLKHRSGTIWPAMVALVTHGVDGEPIGIHRTFLTKDGNGKAPVEPAKMMLGPCGGGAVRLAEPRDLLMIGEGIETCLAAVQATGHPAWAALSTSGLRSLDLPANVRDVIVLADGDDAGEAAANECALRWKREGRRVHIARPPRGVDFNDVLMGCAPCIGEGA
jgi:hypothetical protein